MPIPAEFTFKNEAQFISELLIPLLRRLGFSVVVDYHGTRELGKDLVFAEIDHFGHVRFDGLQAKFLASIGLNDIEELIADCRQAFANPFRHPHTGAVERISTFYAVNGGSISDQAREHFFNSLAQPFGGNVRLLDGKGLLSLDRWAAANRSQMIVPDLNGLAIELEYNRKLAAGLNSAFQEYAKEYGLGTNISKPSPVPSQRFRIHAAATYLRRPFFVDAIPANEVEIYWENASLCNAMMDKVVGLTTVAVVDQVVEAVMRLTPCMDRVAATISSRITNVLQSLGPLSGV